MAFASYYKINGFVDTNKTIGENLDKIAQAAAAFITFDVQNGKFSILFEDWRRNETVPANQFFTLRTAPHTVIDTQFDDDNILGTMIVTEMPDDEIYNFGEIKFNSPSVPGKFDILQYDLKDWGYRSAWFDNFEYSAPYYELFNFDINDPPKKLSITNEFINNDSQASIVLRQLLHSSRQDQLVEFETDFSMLGLTPGDNIIIANENLGFGQESATGNVGVPAKVIEVEETDTEDGNIILKVIAQPVRYDQYESAFGGFTRRQITRAAGIPPIKTNTDVATSNDDATLATLANLNIPVVGGGTDVYTSTFVAQTQANAGFFIPFMVENIFFTLALPYNNTAGSYYSGTVNVHKDPTFDAFGLINSTSSIIDTFTFGTDTPTINMQYEDTPQCILYISVVWDSTPSASDLDNDRYERISGTASDTGALYGITGPMKLGRSFLYTTKV